MTQALRGAIDAAAMGPLLEAAGAPGVAAGAGDVLRETAAATVARRIALASPANPEWPVPAPPVTPEVLERARAAVWLPAVERVVAASPAATLLRAESVQQALALELGAIAGQAARFAAEEGRPVCANCVAVGAARSAEDGSSFLSLQLPTAAPAFPAAVEGA